MCSTQTKAVILWKDVEHGRLMKVNDIVTSLQYETFLLPDSVPLNKSFTPNI